MRITSLLALTTILSACGRSQPTISVAFTAVPGLHIGAPLRFRGLAIGHVESIHPMREGAKVNVVLDRADAPLRMADRIAVVPDGILGASALELVLGPNSASPLSEHATLAAGPSDSLTILREAIVRAVAKEAVDQWRRGDSSSARGSLPPHSKP